MYVNTQALDAFFTLLTAKNSASDLKSLTRVSNAGVRLKLGLEVVDIRISVYLRKYFRLSTFAYSLKTGKTGVQ